MFNIEGPRGSMFKRGAVVQCSKVVPGFNVQSMRRGSIFNGAEFVLKFCSTLASYVQLTYNEYTSGARYTLESEGKDWPASIANAKKSEVANTSFFGGLCSLKNCAPLALLLVCLPAWVWPCHRLRMRDVLHWLPVEQRKVACSSSLS